MRQFYPDRNCLALFRGIVLAISALIYAFIIYFSSTLKTLAISGIIIGTIAAALIFVYLPLYFSSLKYTVSNTEIIKRSGVFLKNYQSVKFSSVQYASVMKTPLSAYTGLNFVVFFVFGGSMRLLFLKKDDIAEILKLSGVSAGGEI